MDAPALRFRVSGIPVPQGSKRIGRRGARPVILDDNDKVLKRWRADVATAAQIRLMADPTWRPILGPVQLALAFGFTRPASHPKTRTTWPTGQNTTGDIDKLARAAMDALTGIAYRDDAQVITLHAAKDWCGQGVASALTLPGLIVRVWRLEAAPTSGAIPLQLTEQDPS